MDNNYEDRGELGRYNPNNKLNELTGKQWIKFTKSWFKHSPPPRGKDKILHPASFPESLIKEFIEFFTKSKQVVLDPFLGTGSTILACQETGRSGVGIELLEKYAQISKERISQVRWDPNTSEISKELFYKVITGDSRNLSKLIKDSEIPKKEFDFCITSPPYWDQLKRATMRQKERKDKNWDTHYSDNPNDIGNIDDYEKFLTEQKKIFNEVYEVLKNKGYLVIITNNVFADGRMYPLAFDTVRSLSDKWVPKDEKIWLQDDKSLIPLGVNSAWVGNRHHQYCLIFRKEK